MSPSHSHRPDNTLTLSLGLWPAAADLCDGCGWLCTVYLQPVTRPSPHFITHPATDRRQAAAALSSRIRFVCELVYKAVAEMSVVKLSVLVLVSSVLTYFLVQQLARKPLPIRVEGFTAPGYEHLRTVFRENFESDADEAGAAYAAYHRGRLVADLWGGYADADTYTPWTRDTTSVFYSTTKGVAALVMAMLVDRGHIQYDHLVSRYWPEFAQNGKENVTVKMIVTHQSGVHSFLEPFTSFDQLGDFTRLGKLLETRRPSWPPGTRHGYHGVTLGSLIDQLVRRVDPKHRSIGQFFKEEVAQPCDIDFTIGTPRQEHHRIARFYVQSMTLTTVKKLLPAIPRFAKSMLVDQRYMKELLADFENFDGNIGGFLNSPDALVHEVAAANGVGTASAMAKLYNLLITGSTCKGHSKPLIPKKMVRQMTTALTSGVELITGGEFMQFSYGFFVLETPKGNNAFGSPGFGMQDGYGDIDHQVSWAYLTNTLALDQFGDERGRSLRKALYDIIDKQK